MVTNYGVGGTTLMRAADAPYVNTSAFKLASASDADIVVLMLGTNDAKKQNWPLAPKHFLEDYKAMIEVFRAMPSRPEILIMSPPPLYRDGVYGMLQVAVNTELQRYVPLVARANGLRPPVDLFSLWQSHCPIEAGTPGHAPSSTDVYCDWVGSGGRDGCHPDNVGYGKLAEVVRDTILEKNRRL